MSHLILPAAIILSVLSTRDAALLAKLQGTWRIEGIAFSRGLESTPLARSFKARIGEYVLWDTEQKMLLGLPGCPLSKIVLRPERQDSGGIRALELRDPEYNLFKPGIFFIRDTRLFLCYGCNSGEQFPTDFEVERAVQPLILLTLRRIDNHPGLEASRRLVARMQGKWRVAAVISTDDRGEVKHDISDLRGSICTITGNVIQCDVPAPRKTGTLHFAINAAHEPARIYTRDFCGIIGFDSNGRLKIAAYRVADFIKGMVPRELEPPESFDEIGPRKLYLTLEPIAVTK